jgi:hypothetical protein
MIVNPYGFRQRIVPMSLVTCRNEDSAKRAIDVGVRIVIIGLPDAKRL